MSKSKRSSTRVLSRFGPLVLIAGLVIVFVLVGASVIVSRPDAPITVEALPTQAASSGTDWRAITSLSRAQAISGEWYTLYFTRPTYPETKKDRQGGVDDALAADIERAQLSIDVAIYDIRLPSIVDSLVRAVSRGVRVRLVVDYTENQAAEEFTDAIAKLEKAGAQVIRDDRSALMHNKFMVVDERVLWTGSMNFTPNDAYRNNNNMVRVTVPELIENYRARFEWIFQARGELGASKATPYTTISLPGGVKVWNYYSPTGGAQRAILARLEGAKKSIRITAFTFTDTDIGALLKDKHNQNLRVQGVFETRNNNVLGAEYQDLKKAGLDVLEDGNCYSLHSKTIVIDDSTVITGSYNFTDSANRSNDENLLIIDDPQLAQAYGQEFDRIYQQAKNPTRCGGE